MGEQHADLELALDTFGPRRAQLFRGNRGNRLQQPEPAVLLAGLGPERARDRQRGGDPRALRRARRGAAALDAGEAHGRQRAQLAARVDLHRRLRPVLRRLRRGGRELPARHDALRARPAAAARRRARSRRCPNPLPGLWYVGQGSFTHRQPHRLLGLRPAQDRQRAAPRVADRQHEPRRQLQLRRSRSSRRSAGTVFSLANDDPDHPAVRPTIHRRRPNFLFLEIPGNLGLLFSHTKQGTIPFAQGNPVAAGALVGRVGHSGVTRLAAPALRSARRSPHRPEYPSVPLGISNANGRAQPDGERSVAPRRGVVGDPRGLLRAAGARCSRRARVRDRARRVADAPPPRVVDPSRQIPNRSARSSQRRSNTRRSALARREPRRHRERVARAGDLHLGLDRHRPRAAPQLGALRDRGARAQRIARVDARARSRCRRRLHVDGAWRPSTTRPCGVVSRAHRAHEVARAPRRPRSAARSAAAPSGVHSLRGRALGAARTRAAAASAGSGGRIGSTSWHSSV